jgi:5-methylcytosine-specific restriction endonuclease McrA
MDMRIFGKTLFAGLALATVGLGVTAPAAQARTDIYLGIGTAGYGGAYGGYDGYRDGHRHRDWDRRRDWDDRRDWRHDRRDGDRWEGRRYGYRGWDRRRDRDHCWTEVRRDGWGDARRIRVCR